MLKVQYVKYGCACVLERKFGFELRAGRTDIK